MSDEQNIGGGLKAPRGVIRGTGEIRDANGKLKGTFTFEGPTDLTREELEATLGREIPETPKESKP